MIPKLQSVTNFSIVDSGEGFYLLQSNQSYQIIGSLFVNNFDCKNIILKASFNIPIIGSISNADLIKLYVVDDNNFSHYVDSASISNGVACFDFTPFAFSNKERITGFYIANESNNSIKLDSIVNACSLVIDYIRYSETYFLSPHVSDYLNKKMSYSYCNLNNRFQLNYSFFNDTLPLDIMMVYSNDLENFPNSFFPIGWKVSCLDYLLISRNQQNQISTISFVDKNNFKHEFSSLTLNNNEIIYYSNNGSCFLIKEIVNNNVPYLKLFNNINNSYKLFDASGKLVSVCDEYGHQTLGVQYYTNYIDITDANNNIIRFVYDSNLSKISVNFNNTLLYELSIFSGLLSSISYSIYTDSFNYVDGFLFEAFCTDGNYVELTYVCNKIIKIEKLRALTLIDSYSLDSNYLETIITNRHEISTFYRYDSELQLISSGELPDDEEDANPILSFSNGMLIEDVFMSLSNPNGVGYQSFLTGGAYTQLNTSSNSLENDFFLASGDTIDVKANHKYILLATLEKEADIPISNTRQAYIKVKFGNAFTNTLYFDSYKKKQTKAFLIKATSNSFPQIYVYAKGFKNFGGVTFKNISLLEFKGNATSYYVRKESNDPQSINGFDDPASVLNDNVLWYRFNTSQFTYSGQSFIYSFDDLIANFIGAYRQDNLYWRNDCHELIQSLNGYYIKDALSNSSSNSVFAKKTISKLYLDANDNERQIFQFEFFEKTASGFKKTVSHVKGTEQYKIVEEYDNQLHLLSKTENDDYYESREYDLNGNIISLNCGNSIDNQIIQQERGYDSLNRNSYESDGVVSQLKTYLNNTHLISSMSFVENNQSVNTTTYSYASRYLYTSIIAQGSSYIHRSDATNLQLTYIESGDTTLLFTYDAYGLIKSSIVCPNALEKPFPSMYRSLNPHVDYFSVGQVRYTYNIYGQLQYFGVGEPANNYTNNTKFIYCINKPDDLNTITEQDSDELSSQSKLYKIIDGNSNLSTLFSYDEEGKMAVKKVKGNNFSYDWSYEYDVFNRASSKEIKYPKNGITQVQNSLTLDIEYQNIYSSSLKKLSYTLFTGNASQLKKTELLIEYDGFHRIASTSHLLCITSFNQGKKYLFTEYNYLSIDSNKTSQYVARVDYRIKNLPFNLNGNITYTNLFSEYLSYNYAGDIISIRKGSLSSPDNTTGASYSYDGCGRLIDEVNLDLEYEIEYVYDINGNLVSVTKTNLNNNTSTTEQYTYSATYKDLLVSHNGNLITYDTSCNPLTYGNSISFSWNNNHLLQTITINNNTTSFEYDYRGIRTSKTDSNNVRHSYFLDDKLIVGERITVGSSFTNNVYLYGVKGPISIIVDGTIYNLQTNIFGDVVAIFNNSNNIVATYIYDAFGNHVVLDANGNEVSKDNQSHIGRVNPFRYRGYYYDEETDLYYCESRYYDPKIRRWLTPDGLYYIDINRIDGANPFAYCLNSPIKYSDPSGHLVELILAFLLAKASFAFAKVLTSFSIYLPKFLLNIFEGYIEYLIFKELGFVSQNKDDKISINYSYLILGLGRKIGFLVGMFSDKDENYHIGSIRSFTSYLIEWEIHNAIFYPACLLDAIFPENNLFKDAIIRTRCVDMENSADWFKKMWEGILK